MSRLPNWPVQINCFVLFSIESHQNDAKIYTMEFLSRLGDFRGRGSEDKKGVVFAKHLQKVSKHHGRRGEIFHDVNSNTFHFKLTKSTRVDRIKKISLITMSLQVTSFQNFRIPTSFSCSGKKHENSYSLERLQKMVSKLDVNQSNFKK